MRRRVSPSHSPGAKECASPKVTGSPKGRLSPATRTDHDNPAQPRWSGAPVRPPPGFNFPPSASKPTAITANPATNSRTSDVTKAFQDGAVDAKSPFIDSFPNHVFGQLPQLGHLTPDVTSTSSPQQQPPQQQQQQQSQHRSSSAFSSHTTSERSTPTNTADPRSLANTSTVFTTPSAADSTTVTSSKPSDLASLLSDLNLSKYLSVFDEQDVDLSVFLTLSDADLKEVGIKCV